MAVPETRYARNGDVHLAYQVVGEGPHDVVFVPNWLSHIEHLWEEPGVRRFLERIASFSRLILFDRRGTGLSDRAVGTPVVEDEMHDVLAVLDAAGSERAALFAITAAAPMSMLFAASHPERTTHLVLYAAMATLARTEDTPWAFTREQRERLSERLAEDWGSGARMEAYAPSMTGDPAFRAWYAKLERLAVSPGSVRCLSGINLEIDMRRVLPAIRVPTLVLHRREDRVVDPRHSHLLAELIPGARRVELTGIDTIPTVGDADALLDEVEEFLTGERRAIERDRVLKTVMFTDIVASTTRAAELGDRRWRDLLGRHDEVVRRELTRHHGHPVKSIGDGFLATFDGPARAIRCAVALGRAVEELGLAVRTGLHTGEVEVIGEDVGGLAVHIGARVSALAGAGEVLVSSTVKDLVVGSEIDFAERGVHALKGVPGEWRLFAVG